MAANDVKKIYQDVINDVCTTVREALSEEGYDDHTLQELRTLWLSRLESSRALEPLPISIVDHATNREFRHSTAGETNNKQSTGVKVSRLHPVSNATLANFNTNYATSTTLNSGVISATTPATTQYIRPNFPIRTTNPTNIGNSTMKSSNQLDGANDEVISKECRKKKSKIIEVEFQLDGTGPPIGDDDDEDEDSEAEGNDVADELDDDDDEDGNEEGREDPNPLCSDDDVSDDEPAELFDTENVVVCQYDKISRTKNKWRFILKSGVMNIEGRDYVFSKATGDADCHFDSIRLTTAFCSSTITLSASSIADSLLAVHEFTTEQITRLLKNDSKNYKVIKNTNNKLSSHACEEFKSNNDSNNNIQNQNNDKEEFRYNSSLPYVPDMELHQNSVYIYQTPCSCKQTYAGQTKVGIENRTKQHSKIINDNADDDNSEIVKHFQVSKFQCLFDPNNAFIIDGKEDYWKRRTKEAIYSIICQSINTHDERNPAWT